LLCKRVQKQFGFGAYSKLSGYRNGSRRLKKWKPIIACTYGLLFIPPFRGLTLIIVVGYNNVIPRDFAPSSLGLYNNPSKSRQSGAKVRKAKDWVAKEKF